MFTVYVDMLYVKGNGNILLSLTLKENTNSNSFSIYIL